MRYLSLSHITELARLSIKVVWNYFPHLLIMINAIFISMIEYDRSLEYIISKDIDQEYSYFFKSHGNIIFPLISRWFERDIHELVSMSL